MSKIRNESGIKTAPDADYSGAFRSFASRGTLVLGAFVLTVLVLLDVVNLPLLAPVEQHFDFSYAVFDSNKKLLRLTLTSDEKHRVLSDNTEYPDLFVQLLLEQEDRFFYRHFGINPVSIVRSLWETYVKQSRKMGGSTITMQTARLLFDFDSSTVSGKLRQLFLALYLETCWKKERILNTYVNLVPCAKNIEGFYSASLFYFGRETASLTPNEMMTLIVIPQNPSARDPSKEANISRVREAVARLYERSGHILNAAGYKSSLVSLHPRIQTAVPQIARHFCEAVIRDYPNTRSHRIVTTLDSRLQKAAETEVREYLGRQAEYGVKNAAVLIADYTTMNVLAYIGSADFFDNSIDGQVDGLRAYRSPGSTLKPFVYLKAADRGIIHSETRLKDAPTTFSAYAPDNYRSQYRGITSASYALSTSRNIPAIELNRKMYADGLYEMLRKTNLKLADKDRYGLSIVVGGAEVSPEILAGLYCALGNGGVYQPLQYTQSQRRRWVPTHLGSPDAAYMVRHMLTFNFPARYADMKNIACKTGTSVGFRDAWTVGLVDNLAIVVWMGNFDGGENDRFLGGGVAQPLFFNLASMIRRRGFSDTGVSLFAPSESLSIKTVPVCAISGCIPEKYCTSLVNAQFIPRVSPIEKCTVHRPVYIDEKTGLRVDFPGAGTRTIVCEFWDSDVIPLLRQAGREIMRAPPYLGELPVESQSRKRPFIREPQENLDYIAIIKETDTVQVPLRGSCDIDSGALAWFVDQQFIASSAPEQTIYATLLPGKYTITCIDEYGFSDQRQLKVRAVR